MFMAFLYPEISKIKNEKKVSLTNLANYLLNIVTLLWQQKCKKIILSERLFVLLLLAPFGTSSQIFKWKYQKIVFMNISPIIEKNPKWTHKNLKFENPSTKHKFNVDLGPKQIFGSKRSKVWVMWGGGSKLKIQDGLWSRKWVYIHTYILVCMYYVCINQE